MATLKLDEAAVFDIARQIGEAEARLVFIQIGVRRRPQFASTGRGAASRQRLSKGLFSSRQPQACKGRSMPRSLRA